MSASNRDQSTAALLAQALSLDPGEAIEQARQRNEAKRETKEETKAEPKEIKISDLTDIMSSVTPQELAEIKFSTPIENNRYFQNMFREGVAAANFPLMIKLFKGGVSIQNEIFIGNSNNQFNHAFYIAIFSGSVKTMLLLLEMGCRVSSREFTVLINSQYLDEISLFPLLIARMRKHYKSLFQYEWLERAYEGAPLAAFDYITQDCRQLTDSFRSNMMTYACIGGHLEVVKKISQKHGTYYTTQLEKSFYFAVAHDHLDVVKYFLTMSFVDNFKNALLYVTSRTMLSFLLEQGFNKEISDGTTTPLGRAIKNLSVPIVEGLIEAGVKNISNEIVNIDHWIYEEERKTFPNREKLSSAIKIKALLSSKLENINSAIGESGETFLHAAVKQNKIEEIKSLLDKNANANIADKEGKTPLFFVRSLEAAKILVERGGAKVDVQDLCKKTVLDQLTFLEEFYCRKPPRKTKFPHISTCTIEIIKYIFKFNTNNYEYFYINDFLGFCYIEPFVLYVEKKASEGFIKMLEEHYSMNKLGITEFFDQNFTRHYLEKILCHAIDFYPKDFMNFLTHSYIFSAISRSVINTNNINRHIPTYLISGILNEYSNKLTEADENYKKAIEAKEEKHHADVALIVSRIYLARARRVLVPVQKDEKSDRPMPINYKLIVQCIHQALAYSARFPSEHTPSLYMKCAEFIRTTMELNSTPNEFIPQFKKYQHEIWKLMPKDADFTALQHLEFANLLFTHHAFEYEKQANEMVVVENYTIALSHAKKAEKYFSHVSSRENLQKAANELTTTIQGALNMIADRLKSSAPDSKEERKLASKRF